jgi:hypothetical protein
MSDSGKAIMLPNLTSEWVFASRLKTRKDFHPETDPVFRIERNRFQATLAEDHGQELIALP